MINVILVGFGNIGNKRYKVLKDDKNFNVLAIIDKKFKLKAKNLNNLKYLKNHKDINLISDKIDLAFISTTPKNSYEIAKFFIKKRVNIFIEKPPCATYEKYKILLESANKNNLLLKVGYNFIFDNFIQQLNNEIKKKKFGKIYYVDGEYLYGTSKTNNNYVGSYLDVGIHLIYISNYLFGELDTSYLYLENNEIKNKIDDNGFVLFKSKNNIPIKLKFSLTHWENRFNFKIVCEKGMFEMCGLAKWGEQKLILSKRVYPSGKPKKKYFFNNNDKSFNKEITHLSHLLQNKKTNLSKVNIQDMKILDIMKKSLKKNYNKIKVKYFNEK